MILGWTYDEGKPVYMEVIDQWTGARKPGWRFATYDDALVIWLDEMGKPEFTHECIHRFNSGDPIWHCYIYDAELADSFLLRWR